jgi:curved DNA-binding protein CbpA
MSAAVDYYATLGVAKNASPVEIKAAWRKAAAVAHPDRPGGSNEKMAMINEAADALLNPVKRIRYDGTGSAAFRMESLVRDTVASLFGKYLEDEREVDIVAAVKAELSEILQNITRQRQVLTVRQRMIEKRRHRLKASAGSEDIAAVVVERILLDCEGKLGVLKQDREATIAALRALDGYTYETEARATPGYGEMVTVGGRRATTMTEINNANVEFWNKQSDDRAGFNPRKGR